MEKTGFCTLNGNLDDSRFSEPMPWIGMYVVAASSACALAMAIDAFHGFRYRKFWFPCKFFALNATTLTLIGVAVKLAIDLNTSMPRPHDQLAKLSSTAFICTSIGNSMPSLGNMETKEMMMNVLALGILVVTAVVNICVQLRTGVIYAFWVEHAVVMFLMVILFAILISTSLAIPTTKSYLDTKYNTKHEIVKKDCTNNNINSSCVATKLIDELMRYWMMAHSSNPQFVIARLATCTASGAFCLLSAMTLGEAILRNYLMPWSLITFCEGESDYKWSSILILITQTIAVGVGTIAPASRWFIGIRFTLCSKMTKFSSIEHYWIHKLCELKGYCPLNFGVRGRKIVHNTKNKALDFCIWLQTSVVVSSKLVRLVSIPFLSHLMSFCKKIVGFWKNSVLNLDAELSEANASGKLDLRLFVVHLEGEEELMDMMMECQKDASKNWIKMGRKTQPRNLIRILETLKSSERGFEGVQKFDRYEVPSLDFEEPPNCWALPVVTLTSIAVAIDSQRAKGLMKCVNEGLKYIRVVEKYLHVVKRDLTKVKKAAEIVWVGVDLNYKWIDVNLREMKGTSPKDIVSELSEMAKAKFMEVKKNDRNGYLRDSPSEWPTMILAANSMYRICESLLLSDECKLNGSCEIVFNRLTEIITDIMGACLTNLYHVISVKCHQSRIEDREGSVRSTILLLGETEKILEILSACQTLPNLNPDQLACVSEWRSALSQGKEPLVCNSSATNSDSNISASSDLYLNIDQELH